MNFLSKLLLRRVVKSALVFEHQTQGLYETLKDELGEAAHGLLDHLIQEERLHHLVLEDMVAGRLDDRALEQMLGSHHYHAVEATVPLDDATRASHGERLERALREEEGAVSYYANLERISSIRAVKLAFRVLADMEREHVEILRMLLGRAPHSEGGGPRGSVR